MLFNSWQYAVFLPIVFALYWLLPHRFRWMLLLAASYYFYMSWNARYVVLILLTTLVSYLAALLLERARTQGQRKLIVTLSLLVCLGVLAVFKYFNFFSGSLAWLLGLFAIPLHPVTLKLLLPVGISFYTFQTLSYVIDVYRGQIKAEHHFGIYATFVSFFPQLVAGPIERTENLLPQLREEHCFDYGEATYGMKLMAWGFFKKMVIADNLAAFADKVFNAPYSYQGFSIVLAALFFAVQIYCDFSGYSDIAVGTAKLLGIRLMTNFKSPYFSASIREFWSRWHISLSTWFRDYFYIPLGGNRVSRGRHRFNLMATFLVSGLWHGASWNFVIWGGIHGLLQIVENSASHLLDTGQKRRPFGRILLVFLFCVFAWVFFRANSTREALYLLTNFYKGLSHPLNYLRTGMSAIGLDLPVLLRLLLFIGILGAFDYASLTTDVIAWTGTRKGVVRYTLYLGLLTLLILFRATGETAFVYFQF